MPTFYKFRFFIEILHQVGSSVIDVVSTDWEMARTLLFEEHPELTDAKRYKVVPQDRAPLSIYDTCRSYHLSLYRIMSADITVHGGNIRQAKQVAISLGQTMGDLDFHRFKSLDVTTEPLLLQQWKTEEEPELISK